jgi:hypothetical protein
LPTFIDERAAPGHDPGGERAVVLVRARNRDIRSGPQVIPQVVLAGGVDDHRHAGGVASRAEAPQIDHAGLRGVMRHHIDRRRDVAAQRMPQVVDTAALGGADQVERGAGEADHLAHLRAEIAVMAALHHHPMLEAAGVRQSHHPLAIQAGDRGRHRDRDAGRRAGGDAAGFASERLRDPAARDRLQLRDLDRVREDRQRGGGRCRARRAAAQHAHRTGGVDDLAQRQRIADICHPVTHRPRNRIGSKHHGETASHRRLPGSP